MLEELLKALGVATVAEAMAAIARYNQMVDETCTLMHARTSGEALDGMRRQSQLVMALETATGAKGPEALARVEGWKASAEQLAATQTQLAEVKKSQERARADGLMQAALQDARLTEALRPKAEEFYNSYGIGALEAFLTSLPKTGIKPSGDIKQPAPTKPETGTDAEWTADDVAYCKATGRTKDQVMAARKLWAETEGKMSHAHIDALNKKASQPRA